MILFLIAVNIFTIRRTNRFIALMDSYADERECSMLIVYTKIENICMLLDKLSEAVEIANKYTDEITELSEYEYDRILREYGRNEARAVGAEGEFQSDRDLLLDMFRSSAVVTDKSDARPWGVYYYIYNVGDVQAAVCLLKEKPEKLYTSKMEIIRWNHSVFGEKRRFVNISGNLYVMYILREQVDNGLYGSDE